MNALEFRLDSSRFAPVRRLQTAGTHWGVHRGSLNEALARDAWERTEETDLSLTEYDCCFLYEEK